MNPDISHHYRILELEQGASPSEIKRAYRDLAMVWHPDRFSDPRMQQKAEDRLKQINAAYEFLKSYQPKTVQHTAETARTEEPQSKAQPTSQRKWESRDLPKPLGERTIGIIGSVLLALVLFYYFGFGFFLFIFVFIPYYIIRTSYSDL
jgi:preprotein translocase subunit Sec63